MPVTMRCLSQIGLSKLLIITAQNPFIAVRPVTTIKAAFNHALIPVMPIMLTDVTVSVPPSPNTGRSNNNTIRACLESLRARPACIFSAIFREFALQYDSMAAANSLHLAKNLTAQYAHAEILNRL